MRTLLSAVLCVVSFSCTSRGAEAVVAPRSNAQLKPLPVEPGTVRVLPGDLVSWVQANPPRLLVQATGFDPLVTESLMNRLREATRITNASGESMNLEATLVGVPLERLPDAQTDSPPGVLVGPVDELGEGWHSLEVDLSRISEVAAAGDDLTIENRLIARFAIESSPTVRRMWLCRDTGRVQIQFSEPVQVTTGQPLVLTGKGLDCTAGLAAGGFDPEQETYSVQCKSTLPEALGVRLDGFASTASDRGVLTLDQQRFDVELQLEQLLEHDGCRVYRPMP